MKQQRAPRHHPTPQGLALRVRRVALALHRGDEQVARAELRLLADEARLLAAVSPLPLPRLPHDSLARRQQLKVESDRLGAIG